MTTVHDLGADQISDVRRATHERKREDVHDVPAAACCRALLSIVWQGRHRGDQRSWHRLEQDGRLVRVEVTGETPEKVLSGTDVRVALIIRVVILIPGGEELSARVDCQIEACDEVLVS